MDQAFRDAISAGYAFDEPSLIVGSAMHEGELFNDVRVCIADVDPQPPRAGGRGDRDRQDQDAPAAGGAAVKGGRPGVRGRHQGRPDRASPLPGDGANPKVQERVASLGWQFEPSGHPVEFLSLSGKNGAQVRATVSSFGPLLLGKVLDLNETQTSVLALVFKYCDDNDLPLLDLKDLATTLKFLSSDEGKPILEDYGGMSTATVGVLLRSIVVLEQEGADVFFGEPEFEVEDLIRTTADGQGVISILELADVMDQPRLF